MARYCIIDSKIWVENKNLYQSSLYDILASYTKLGIHDTGVHRPNSYWISFDLKDKNCINAAKSNLNANGFLQIDTF